MRDVIFWEIISYSYVGLEQAGFWGEINLLLADIFARIVFLREGEKKE